MGIFTWLEPGSTIFRTPIALHGDVLTGVNVMSAESHTALLTRTKQIVLDKKKYHVNGPYKLVHTAH